MSDKDAAAENEDDTSILVGEFPPPPQYINLIVDLLDRGIDVPLPIAPCPPSSKDKADGEKGAEAEWGLFGVKRFRGWEKSEDDEATKSFPFIDSSQENINCSVLCTELKSYANASISSFSDLLNFMTADQKVDDEVVEVKVNEFENQLKGMHKVCRSLRAVQALASVRVKLGEGSNLSRLENVEEWEGGGGVKDRLIRRKREREEFLEKLKGVIERSEGLLGEVRGIE